MTSVDFYPFRLRFLGTVSSRLLFRRYAPVLAVRAYGRMKRAGFQADEQVHDAVLRACAAAGLWTLGGLGKWPPELGAS